MFKKFRIIFALMIGKSILCILRFLNLGGTTLPGKIAYKLSEDVLTYTSNFYDIIMITGTNGKTTTARIVEALMKQTDLNYISNKSGANLTSGITSALLKHTPIFKKPVRQYAILEIDEAAFSAISDKVLPKILIVTNLFRDQLDRYGELYTTLEKIREGINKSPNTTLILNADDSLCSTLGKGTKNNSRYFSISINSNNFTAEKNLNNDAKYCIYCKSEYRYTYRTYAHLGGFYCETCGYSQPKADCLVTEIKSLQKDISKIKIKYIEGEFESHVKLPGVYNIYNALSAATLAYELKISEKSVIFALSSFECGFGRMETIDINDKIINIILVKNPTGFMQVLNYLVASVDSCVIAFLLNDKEADGTDVSWIWDVNFEILSEIKNKVKTFYTSGLRGEDLSVRLKYANMSSKKIHLEKDYLKLINKILTQTEPSDHIYFLPTYTAMLDLRKILVEKFNLKEFWE